MGKPHILAVPYPAQGHVIPLLELSQTLVKHGCKVTFVNTDYNHERVVRALEEHKNCLSDDIELVSIPDGMGPEEDRNELGNLCLAIMEVMRGELEDLILRINSGSGEDGKIACVVADWSMAFACQVAEKMGIPNATFWPASAVALSLLLSIPKLLDEGIIDQDGIVMRPGTVQLAPGMPCMRTKDFFWSCIGDCTCQTIVFRYTVDMYKFIKASTWKLCNSNCHLEPAAFNYLQDILPIGPLLASNRLGDQLGSFWKEDSACLKWLDKHPPSSVVYVAFGSFTVMDKTQFQELALGLEHLGKPFLWVVRPDLTSSGTVDAYPEGFQDRVRERGRLVGWAPQQKVLSHPSIACFVTHCGWNSTMEGIGNGLPFLCWPYFADQLFNESYICDVWKVGLRFERNGCGIIGREEIRNKIEQVMGGEGFKMRALKLKQSSEIEISEGGQSSKNVKSFIDFTKA